MSGEHKAFKARVLELTLEELLERAEKLPTVVRAMVKSNLQRTQGDIEAALSQAIDRAIEELGKP